MNGSGPSGRAPGARWLFVPVGALVGALVGCAGRVADPVAPPPSHAAARRLLAGAAAAAEQIRRYQSVLGVRGEGERGRFSGRLLVVFERPERSRASAGDPAGVAAMRLEGYGPVGGPRWSLVAAPGRGRRVVPAERAFAAGGDLGEFTAGLLGVPVGLRQVAAIVTGTGAPLDPARAMRLDPVAGSALLPEGERIFWENAGNAGLRVRRVVTADYEVRYPGEGWRAGRQAPRRIRIASERVRATLTVEELRVNAPLHADSFRLRIPGHFRRAEVGSLAGAMRLPER